VNIINFITFLVIVIGSAALFVVLSAFTGLKTFSLSFSNSFDPDLKASPVTGKFFFISPEQEQKLSEIKGITAYAKELEERVYLKNGDKSQPAYIKGVDENYNAITGMDSILYLGSWIQGERQGVVGIGIANALDITINSTRNPLVLMVPKPGKGSFSQQTKLLNEIPVVVSGLYYLEEDLDKKYVFTDLKLVRALLEKDSTQISGINFKLNEKVPESETRLQIAGVFDQQVLLANREEQNSTLHKMLNTENVATYLIFTLVLIIALFNVVGAIIMMILDKQQNSKTLFNLGATLKELRRIYFVQGVLVTSIGGVVGVLIGALLIASQLLFGWVKIGVTLAYPVEFRWVNLVIVLATIVVLGVVASKIASRSISKKLITT